jgi:hypothetical protein
MKYYLALCFAEESGPSKEYLWTETFGSTDKTDVSAEIEGWRDQADREDYKIKVYRKTFDHEPTGREVSDFAESH